MKYTRQSIEEEDSDYEAGIRGPEQSMKGPVPGMEMRGSMPEMAIQFIETDYHNYVVGVGCREEDDLDAEDYLVDSEDDEINNSIKRHH